MDQHTRLLVKNILTHPYGFSWSVQGLGMTRIYLSETVRLHIWDSRFRFPEVSAIHSHPWDLSPEVMAGRCMQFRFSLPGNGVTLVTRTFSEDRDYAKVYWRGKGSWVDAKPRSATEAEVKAVTQHALSVWF